MPIQHNIKIAGETYTNIDSLQMNGANSEEGKTIEYICPEWDNLSFDDTTPILGTHTTDKDGFDTVTIESDDLKSANIIESATIFGVKGAIPVNEDADITVHGNRLTVPAGYYPNMTARTVDNGTLTVTKNFDTDTGKFTASAKVSKNGYLTSANNTSTEIQLDTVNANTIYPSTSEQIAVPANHYTLGEIKVAAMEYASGSLGGDAYNGKATPDIHYDSVEGIKTTKPSGSDFITIGASVRTEPAGYAPRYNVLQAGYIGTSLYADKENIPVIAKEDKVIYIETNDGTTITPSTEEQTIELTGKLMQGDVVVEAMPEGELGSLVLEEKDGVVNASLAIRAPGYVDELDYRTNTLELSKATLSWTVGTVPGSCEAKITNQDNIRTVNANHDGDYYTIKATAIGNDGEAGLDVTEFTAGYLSTNPIDGSSYVGVSVASDEIGKEIHIPKATLSASGATVSVTEAGYLPEGESQTVQSGAYKASASANAKAEVSATGGNIIISTQSTSNPPNSGYYFKVTGIANATATSTAQITTAGYLNTGDQSTQDTDSQEATAYYTIPDGKVEVNDDKIEFNAIVNEEVQTGDYGRPYYKIEVQQGSENTSVGATVTQSGYVTAGKEVDSTPLTVNVSGAVFQSQIADPRSITNATADATIGYQQEVQIGAGYYPYSRVVKNGVQAIDRAQTEISVFAYDTSDKMTVKATNNQATGYVTADLDADDASVDIQLTQGTPSINSSTGVISATATMASGTKQVSQSKTLSLNTKGPTTITPSTEELTAVEAGVYTTGEIKVAAIPTVNRAQTTIGAATASLNKMTITASNDQATGYVEGSDEDASLDVELTASGRTVTATAGDISISKQVAVGKVQTPATTITAEPTISIEDGVITASISANQSITPSVTTPGYITSGTAGTVTVSGSKTKALEKNSGGTYTPGTQDITVGKKGDYLTGSITIAGDPDLVPDKIKEGVTIFGVTGTYNATPTGTNITTGTLTIENSGSHMTLTALLPICVNGYVTTSVQTVAEYSSQTFTDVMEDMPIMIYVTNTSGYWHLYNPTGVYCYIAEELGSGYDRVSVFGCVLESGSSIHSFWIGHDCCFDGTSKVLLPNGATKALVDINIGDTVMSYNETTGTIEENKVTALGTVELRRATQITLADDTVIRMNIYHPLYTQDGWKSITRYNGLPELTIEDKLLNSEGEYISIKSIENVVIDEATYYTLKVEGNNNFYVNGMLAQGKDKD